MNNQEAFDKAVRGLASQGFRRSMAWFYPRDAHASASLMCAYTSDDGKRHCAFGWLIEGIDLPSDQNAMFANALIEEHPKVRARVDGLTPVFLRDLQVTHDSAQSGYGLESPDPDKDDPALMVANLRAFAGRWELDPAVLNELAPEGRTP